MNRNAIASLVCLSALLAGTWAFARPARNVHAVTEYTGIAHESAASQVSESGGVMQPGETRPVHHVIVAKGSTKLWKCGAEQASAVGGTYRACEWEAVK